MTIRNEDPRIGDPEEPSGFSHTEINNAFRPLVPGEHGMMASDQYGEIARLWEQGVQVFAARIRRSSSAAWDGPAAEQSRQAIGDYATRAEDLVPALNALATQVYNAVVAIMRTQTELPEVPEERSLLNSGGWSWLPGVDYTSRGDAEEQARQVMSDEFVKPFTQVDGLIPAFGPPVNPTAPVHTDLPAGQPAPGVPGSTSTGDNPAGPTPGAPAGEVPSQEQQPGEGPPAAPENTGPGDPATTAEGPQDPASTTPSTTTAGVPATTPSTTTPGTTTTPGAPGSPAPGSPGGVPAPGAPPAPGATLPGAPRAPGAPGVPGATGTPTGAAGAPRTGMPGMMSPGAAGRGGQSQDDERDGIPDYLITAENTRELLGEPEATLPDGTLGGDAPSAQPSRDT
ncbi:hypothetical protein [Nocardia flavorosea]|uniref:hypothetical protein n=1 Tax=Nocardia flavorosea TaxID=53429 RepID=UPI0024550F66|nr:hypothetical protein [Nocardia flavorosea]